MRFSKANAKIQALSNVDELKPYLQGKRKVYSFDLLSGWSCPFAKECLSRAVTGPDGKRKIKDGKDAKVRCFSSSQEVQYPALYNLRKGNFDELRAMGGDSQVMAAAILSAMPKDAGIIRIHVGGDFFNEAYMLAWFEVANSRPDVLFYAYTKSLPYLVSNLEKLPNNFSITASRGGRYDYLIDEYNLREAVIVFSEEQAQRLGLEIDHDDSHAAVKSNKSFALLIHGTQPAGSEAGAALQQLKADNVQHSYPRKAAVV